MLIGIGSALFYDALARGCRGRKGAADGAAINRTREDFRSADSVDFKGSDAASQMEV